MGVQVHVCYHTHVEARQTSGESVLCLSPLFPEAGSLLFLPLCFVSSQQIVLRLAGL